MRRKKRAEKPLVPFPRVDCPPTTRDITVRLWGDTAELGVRARGHLAELIAKNAEIRASQVKFVAAGASDAAKPDKESKRGGVEGG